MLRAIYYRIIFRLIGKSLFILGAGFLISTVVAAGFSEPLLPFIGPALITVSLGLVIHVVCNEKENDRTIRKREAYLTVSLTWIVISILGCLPYIFSGVMPSVIDAVFESVSGFTTTGSSILSDVESLPRSILFWRSMTHWIGGVGIIVLVIIIMPSLHISGYHLFSLESSLHEKIKPRIKSVGKNLLIIYISLTLLEIFFLVLGGMNLFDSTCHAFGTVATGGFSTKNNSLEGYSPYIQYTVMVFMLLAGVNFIFYYYLFTRRFKRIKRNDEIKLYLKVVFIGGLLVSSILFFGSHETLETSFRQGFFQFISIITCTGFSTTDYLLWPQCAWLLLFFAMFLGGCTGSTAGGIKMARHIILLKNIKRYTWKLISPNAQVPLRLNNEIIESEINNSIMSFITVYILIFVLGSIILIFLKVDVKTSLSAVATCMAGIGPGLGKVGPMSNFSHLSSLVKLILSFIMLIGRLEIYTVLVLFTPSFWKI